MLMALTLTGSFAACDMGGNNNDNGNSNTGSTDTGSTDTGSTDGGSTGGGSIGGGDIGGGIGDIIDDVINGEFSDTAKQYAAAVNATLAETKSVKISAELNLLENAFDDALGTVTADIIFTDDNGTLSMMIDATSNYTEGGVAEKEYASVIMKGGYLYARSYSEDDSADNKIWNRMEAPIIPTDFSFLFEAPEAGTDEGAPSMMVFIQQIFATKEMQAAMEFLGDAYDAVWMALMDAGTIENNVWSTTTDFAPVINYWNEYAAVINEGTMTYGAFVEDFFKRLGVTVSYDQLLNDISILMSKTANEGIEIVENFAQNNFDMTLQEMKDALVESEIGALLLNLMTEGDAEMLNAIKAWQFDSLKDMEELNVITLKDLVNMMIDSSMPKEENGSGDYIPPVGEEQDKEMIKTVSDEMTDGSVDEEVETQPTDYVAQYLGMLAEMKTVTLAQMEMYMPEIPVNEITELTMTNSLTFSEDGTKLTGAGVAFVADMNLTIDNYNPEIEDYVPTAGDVKITASLSIDEFVTTATPVTAPAEGEYKDVENGGSGGNVNVGYNEIGNEYGFVRFNADKLEGEYRFGEDYIIIFYSERALEEEEYGYGRVIYFNDMEFKPINMTQEEFKTYMEQYAQYDPVGCIEFYPDGTMELKISLWIEDENGAREEFVSFPTMEKGEK